MKLQIRLSALLAIPLVFLPACATAPTPPPAPAPTNRALTAGDHEWKTKDGNTMPYTVAGEGDVTVLFVHCWMCDRTFWSAQVGEVAKHYRTLAVDLPGHGQASATRATWTVEGYGEDVAGLIEGLDLSNVVLVGHSMGGPVSLRAAALAQGRVRGIVAVDTLHDAEFKFPEEQLNGILENFRMDFAGTCAYFIDQMLPEADVEQVKTKVKEAGCNEARSKVGIALMRDFGKIDMAKWFSEAKVPIRAINAAGGNPTKIDVNRKYADYDAVTMEGVGHYLQMTRPAEFNPLLLDAIAKLASTR